MAVTTRTMDVPHSAVLEVLRDGSSYARWVVGTQEITEVGSGFPAPGTSLAVTVGPRPFSSPGRSLVQAWDPAGHLVLHAAAFLVGSAKIDIVATPLPGDRTHVRINERPAHRSAWTVLRPAVAVLMFVRNIETLRRLEATAAERVPVA